MAQRANQQWIAELSGRSGAAPQRIAHEDLGRYLYVVSYNYLRMREGDVTALTGFGRDELAALAQDFVQETLEKLVANNFALLNSYRGAGNFTSWAAQIARNQVAQELRKSYWQRRVPLPHGADGVDEDGAQPLALLLVTDDRRAVNPERETAYRQVCAALHCCLEELPERYRAAILNCLGEGMAAGAVAAALNTTANAIYLMVHRGKRQLKACLQRAGVGPEAQDLVARA